MFFYRVAENGDFVNFTSFVFLINISVLLASVTPSELLLGRIVILSWPIAVSTSLTYLHHLHHLHHLLMHASLWLLLGRVLGYLNYEICYMQNLHQK